MVVEDYGLAIHGLEGMTQDEFFAFCAKNRDLRMERRADGEVIIMAPVSSISGFFENFISGELHIYNRQEGAGIVFSSSTGFRLPDGSIRSADTAFLSLSKWESLTHEEQDNYARICPEFVVELASPSDKVSALQQKMEMWIDNGVQLGWLIIPSTFTVYVYRPYQRPEQFTGKEVVLSGENVLPGFEFPMKLLQKPGMKEE